MTILTIALKDVTINDKLSFMPRRRSQNITRIKTSISLTSAAMIFSFAAMANDSKPQRMDKSSGQMAQLQTTSSHKENQLVMRAENKAFINRAASVQPLNNSTPRSRIKIVREALPFQNVTVRTTNGARVYTSSETTNNRMTIYKPSSKSKKMPNLFKE